jgi:hypothetical protein
MIIRCRKCHRQLHDPISCIEGLGPVCGKRDKRQLKMFPELLHLYRRSSDEEETDKQFVMNFGIDKVE